MTETDAKEKWCPLRKGAEDANCIGSDCMMWRWDGVTLTAIASTADVLNRRDDGSAWFQPVPPPGSGWVQSKQQKTPGVTQWYQPRPGTKVTWTVPHGYCGMAGTLREKD